MEGMVDHAEMVAFLKRNCRDIVMIDKPEEIDSLPAKIIKALYLSVRRENIYFV